MMIDMYITSCNTTHNWFATGLYGSPYHPHKKLICDAINDLFSNKNPYNWLIFGDFNLILGAHEKQGGHGLDYNHTIMFNTTLNQCNLTDLGYNGYKYTWANNQSDQAHIKARLDRFCANSNWLNSFPYHINTHLLRFTSDHSPILLEFSEYNQCRFSMPKNKIRRFEQVWAKDTDSH